MSSDTLSDPLVSAGLLLALASVILVLGLALHMWANRRSGRGSQRSGEGDAGVEQGNAEAERTRWVVEEKPRVENAREAREDFARVRSEAEQTLKANLDAQLKTAVEQFNTAREATAEAVDEGVRKAVEANAALEGKAEALQAHLAESGEMAAAKVQREGRKAAVGLSGQEKRAAEKLTRKAMRRERRERRELIRTGQQPASWPRAEDFEGWIKSFEEAVDARIEEFRKGSEDRIERFEGRIARFEDSVANGRSAGDWRWKEEIAVRIERLEERLGTAEASFGANWLPETPRPRRSPVAPSAAPHKPGAEKAEPARETPRGGLAKRDSARETPASTNGELRDEDRRWVEQFLTRSEAAEESCGRADKVVARVARLIGPSRQPGD